jgi:hypothetical protein
MTEVLINLIIRTRTLYFRHTYLPARDILLYDWSELIDWTELLDRRTISHAAINSWSNYWTPLKCASLDCDLRDG